MEGSLVEKLLIVHPLSRKNPAEGGSPHLRFIPPLNNNFHLNPRKTSYLAVIIAPIQFLF